jgi:pimeloyl-ACP methyl ester carboxylesterase
VKGIGISSTSEREQKGKAKPKISAAVWIRRILIGLIALLAVLLIAGMGFQAVATAIDARRYPPPGQMVDLGGYRLHIYCTGESRQGSPTVILDSHNGGTVSGWVWVQQAISNATRVCAYDRAGLGWSDLSPQPQDVYQNAQALHTLLEKAGVPGPYVLVGHSLGGLFVRGYADRYPDEVIGMVLIEATNPDFLKVQGKPNQMPGADPGMLNAAPWVARFGLLRLARMFRASPDLPEQQRAEMDAYYATTKFYEALGQQADVFPTLLSQVRQVSSQGAKPLAIVLGSKGDGGQQVLRPLFEQQARLSTNSLTRLIEGAEHINIVYRKEYATQVSSAILEVVEAAQSDQPLGSKK